MTVDNSSARILLVDDAAENIRVLAGLLAVHRISAALDGEQALALARSAARPDLILLDVMMPGMSGLEVCARLKEDPSTREIPIIFITSLGSPHDEVAGFEVGAVDYIAKPFSPPVVRARVSTQLALLNARRQLAEQNAVLEERVAERTQQLQHALDRLKEGSLETIVRLSRAAEYKDDDTGAHVLRVGHYAAAVARQLGQTPEEVELLLHAAPMHDIGKIGVPDRILLKPGKLEPQEWEVMRRHSEMGARILAGSESPIIRLAETVAWTHHERWDGSGYPRGLVGTEIPLAGRIVAVADVFDALTSRRPYKEPLPVDRSFAILREGSGQHFDPDVIEAFFAVEAEILEIRERIREEGGALSEPLFTVGG